ncbi:hypothetical protein, partial [Flavivirga sp. 57AJ16]|uniref:hypothetical protein n=1 Tax=Flavivirga sp. 57AJ16 TaxID=3025307 RepID=UPI0023661A61
RNLPEGEKRERRPCKSEILCTFIIIEDKNPVFVPFWPFSGFISTSIYNKNPVFTRVLWFYECA